MGREACSCESCFGSGDYRWHRPGAGQSFLQSCRSRTIKSCRSVTQSGLLEIVFRAQTYSCPILGSLETDAVVWPHLCSVPTARHFSRTGTGTDSPFSDQHLALMVVHICNPALQKLKQGQDDQFPRQLGSPAFGPKPLPWPMKAPSQPHHDL